MPYDREDQLPEYVRKLSPKKRRQWRHVFNSVYAKTKDEGRAFAAANSVAMEGTVKTKLFGLAAPIQRTALTRVHLGKEGEFVHPAHGPFSLSRDKFNEMIDNFWAMSREEPEIPIDYHHELREAAGWIRGLEIEADDFWANPVEWTPRALQQIEDGEYKYLSMFFAENWKNEKGEPVGSTLIAASLTNVPFMPNLKAVSEPVALESGLHLAEFDLDETELAAMRAKERNALPNSDFAYVDDEGVGHLPVNDEAHCRAAMARLNQTDISAEAKRKAARKIASRARRFGIKVSDDFKKQWLEAVIPVEPSEDGPNPNPTPTGGGETKMIDEAKIKQTLGLEANASEEDVLKALSAVTDARNYLSGSGSGKVISIYEHIKLQQKYSDLEVRLREAQNDLKHEKDKFEMEIRTRDAEAAVAKSISEGKLNKEMADSWGRKLALEAPQVFQEILDSLPELVSLDELGSSGEDSIPLTNATAQFARLVEMKRSESKRKGKELSLGEAQRAVALENPQVWDDHVAQSREASRRASRG